MSYWNNDLYQENHRPGRSYGSKAKNALKWQEDMIISSNKGVCRLETRTLPSARSCLVLISARVPALPATALIWDITDIICFASMSPAASLCTTSSQA